MAGQSYDASISSLTVDERTAKLKPMMNSFTRNIEIHCPETDPAALGALPGTPASPSSIFHF
ncbi:hypothetical protein APTSU1_001166800 [Apodemus speciosus]|uniref:Uncharacterized protein n=1 Tax=Apodemus speciosus TaxID=105296 RepID=A0ABQ0FB03_APOSI